jgi:hypothetical protein
VAATSSTVGPGAVRGGPAVAGDGDSDIERGAVSGSGGTRVGGGRRHSKPVGAGDRGAEGRLHY